MKKIVITLLISFSFIGCSIADEPLDGLLNGTWVFSKDKSMSLLSKSSEDATAGSIVSGIRKIFESWSNSKFTYTIQGDSWISELNGIDISKVKVEIKSKEGKCYRYVVLESNGKAIEQESGGEVCRHGSELHMTMPNLEDGVYVVFIKD